MSQPADQVVAVYDAHGRGWDADRRAEQRTDDHSFEHHWLERLIARLPRAASILDLGCGGGIPITRYLVERGIRVIYVSDVRAPRDA